MLNVERCRAHDSVLTGMQAPWTPAQLEEAETESLLFRFMAPSSRFTRPGWVPVTWPASRLESLHWAQQDRFALG